MFGSVESIKATPSQAWALTIAAVPLHFWYRSASASKRSSSPGLRHVRVDRDRFGRTCSAGVERVDSRSTAVDNVGKSLNEFKRRRSAAANVERRETIDDLLPFLSAGQPIEQALMPSFLDPLWVITSFYNPAKYETRRDNFRTFRKYLNSPLMVVELARPGEHHLTKDDGDIVLRLVGEDRIWQKERLLNIGLAELPGHVEYVAWIDCDVIFEDENWATKAKQKLARNGGLLQLFETSVHIPRGVDHTKPFPSRLRSARAHHERRRDRERARPRRSSTPTRSS